MTRTQDRPNADTTVRLAPDVAHRIAQISNLIAELTPVILDKAGLPLVRQRTVTVRQLFHQPSTYSLMFVGDALDNRGEQIGIDSQGTLWDYAAGRRLRIHNLAAMSYRAISKLHCDLIVLMGELQHS